jgi:polyphosphate kinase
MATPTKPAEGKSVKKSAPSGTKPDSEAPRLRALPKQEPEDPRARTPAHPGALPVPRVDGSFDPRDPACFLNRELTWLNFNFRVLHEAEDERTPLLERVKFLSIVSSNLDEFFMKRIGGLKQQVGAGMQSRTVDGRTPQQQIDECYEVVRELEKRKRDAFLQVDGLLAEQGIRLTTFQKVAKKHQRYLREYYLENIYPLVTPQVSDPAHPFPFISNLSLNLLVTVRHPDDGESSLARVKVPVGPGIPRMLKLQDRDTFVTLESVMANNLDLLFPGMEVESCELFRVTRNANTELDEDKADDLLAMIETELRERKFAPIVRLEVQKGMMPLHRGMLAAELGLDEHADVFEVDGIMAMRDLMQIAALDGDPSLRDAPHHPVDHPDVQSDRNIFHILRDTGSILTHHPYESFSTSVERFLRDASRDPKVLAIKMSLYRTSAESRGVDYLVDAALNGKQVAVAVELKARFDEAANIRWANRLEQAGVHVTYGVVGLKTHSKARGHGASLLRPGADDRRRDHRPGPDRAVQLPDDRLQAQARLPQDPSGAEDPQETAPGEDRTRGGRTLRRLSRPDPAQGERPRGRGRHTGAVPGFAGRRAGRSDRAGHVSPEARDRRAVGERARDQRRRPVSRAQPDPVLPERR